MDRLYSFFDEVADFITRLPIIMLVLAAYMGYRYYEILTLFLEWLPIADPVAQLWAARLISVVFIWSTLIFMVHAFRIGNWVKVVLVIISLVINLYFWKVWEGDWIFKLFISLVNAAFDFGFAYLFHMMRVESGRVAMISEYEAKISELKTEWTQNALELQRISDKKELLLSNIKEYEAILSKVQCPACRQIFATPQALNAHKPKQCHG